MMPKSLLILILILITSVALADDWPFWSGPHLDFTSAETGWRKDWPPEGPPRLWEKAVGEGYSSVSVAEGHLILFHRVRDEDRVESLDPSTGAVGWTFAYPSNYSDSYGYNGGPRAQPLIEALGKSAPAPDKKESSGSRVYTLGPLGILHAFSLADGKKLWSHDLQNEYHLQKNFFGVGAAPILDGDRLLVNLGGTDPVPGSGLTFAIEKETGKVLWKSPTLGGAYAAGRVAEIDGARQLFIFHRGGLTCFDPKDGREKWMFPWMSRTYDSVNAATPVVVGDILFFSAAYRTGSVCLRVKKESYDLLWKDDLSAREKILETHWSTALHVPSPEGGHLYGFSGRHEPEALLSCVELKTGKVLWRWESYLGRGSLIRSDGHFIALGERGDLALLKLSPAGHEELRHVPRVLPVPAWPPPTLANGLLYLRGEHRLICFDLRPPAPAGK